MTTQDKINAIKLLLEEVIDETKTKAQSIIDTNTPLNRMLLVTLSDYENFLKNNWSKSTNVIVNDLVQRLDAFDLDETIKSKSIDFISLPIGTKIILDDEPNKIYTKSKPGLRNHQDRLKDDEIYLTTSGSIGLDLSQEYLLKHATLL